MPRPRRVHQEFKPPQVEMVKVRALKPHVARSVMHLPTGYRFKDDGTSMWPRDDFTKRRLRDGDIAIVEETQAQSKGKPAEPVRERAPKRTEA